MTLGRKLAGILLVLVLGASAAANWLAPAGYAKQYREAADAPPSHTHWLGTDAIGRDRFARVLYGTRISLLLAPAAALLSTLLAALIGGLAGYLGGAWARMAMAVTDLFLSLPWLFLLITARALMPLNVSPLFSVTVTFSVVGVSGLDDRSARSLHQREFTASLGFCSAGAGRGSGAATVVLDACSAEFKTGAVRAILDFDSSVSF